ncbi:GNAT family N-acetyltransferase [Streptomyces sp. NK08204]|uniref:GNAT family N-acetyltransferase n=1 Tax=Streptomyces sp. NK08204 TaxID=2873260 RepID=UPI001CEC877F|nr:hypothetical protein [Streptomyces sp. NK08204]
MSSGHTEVQVRPGVERDLEALTDLCNHYVRETSVTFDTAIFSPEERRPWLLSHPEDGPHRLMVATEGRSRRIPGYAPSSPHRPKPAYATSVETSVHVAPDAGRRGIGTPLYDALCSGGIPGHGLAREGAGAPGIAGPRGSPSPVRIPSPGGSPSPRGPKDVGGRRLPGAEGCRGPKAAGGRRLPAELHRPAVSRTAPTASPAPSRTRRSPTSARRARRRPPPRPW